MTSLVLVYHRVAVLEHDPQHLAVHPDRFAEHLEALAGVADLVPLVDVVPPGTGRRVAITFDDGYADNLEAAVPVLRDAVAPATVFVTTTTLAAGGELWWDRLEDLLLHQEPSTAYVELEIGDQTLRADVRRLEDRVRAVRALSRRLRSQAPAAIEAVLDRLEAQVGGPPPCRTHRMLGKDGVRALASEALVDVGAHTRRHANLGRLSHDAQREEIEGSRDDLTRVLGRPPTAFAYPFGMRGSFDRGTERLVRDAGFTLACANVPGRPGRRDRFHLPRHIATDVPGPELAARVDRWMQR